MLSKRPYAIITPPLCTAEDCKVMPLLNAPVILLRQSFIQRQLQRNAFDICKQCPDLAG